MSARTKNRLLLAVRIIIPVILIYFLLRNLDWNLVLVTLQGYPIWSFIAAVGLYFLANILFGYRWLRLLQIVQLKVSFKDVLRLVLYSLFLSNFLPTTIGGDLVKVAGLLFYNPEGEKSIKVSSVVADRIFSFSSKLILLPFTLWIYSQNIKTDFQIPWLQSGILIGWIPERIRTKIKKDFETIRPWFSVRIIAEILLISWVSLFVNMLSFWLLIHTLNPNISALSVFCIVLLTYFASILPISINGIGVQEGSITYLLTLVGYTHAEGLAAALLIRVATLCVSLVGGILLLFDRKNTWEYLRRFSNSNKEPAVESSE